MKSFGDLVKQAQKIQKQMGEVQERLAAERFEASAGGGLVKAIMADKNSEFTARAITRDVNSDKAKAALKFCLRQLNDGDRFAMLNFASTVTKYTNNLQPATTANLEAARKWVDDLEATGGTAIDDALREALGMRSNDEERVRNKMGLPIQRSLAFLHRLQQGGLGFRRGPVYLISQKYVGEHWPASELEVRGLNVVDVCACDVSRQQVRGELYP